MPDPLDVVRSTYEQKERMVDAIAMQIKAANPFEDVKFSTLWGSGEMPNLPTEFVASFKELSDQVNPMRKFKNEVKETLELFKNLKKLIPISKSKEGFKIADIEAVEQEYLASIRDKLNPQEAVLRGLKQELELSKLTNRERTIETR